MQPLDDHAVWLGLGLGAMLVAILIGLVFLVLAVLVVVQAANKGRSWWLHLIVMFIGPLNLILIIAWFVHLKDHPLRLGPVTI